MNYLILPFLQVNVAEKIKEAPDSSYQTGVHIGSFLPFVLLVGIPIGCIIVLKKEVNRSRFTKFVLKLE